MKGSRQTLARSVFSLFSSRVTEDGHTLNPPGRRSGRLDAQPCAERVQHHVRPHRLTAPITPIRIYKLMTRIKHTSMCAKCTAAPCLHAMAHPIALSCMGAPLFYWHMMTFRLITLSCIGAPLSYLHVSRSRTNHVELHWRSMYVITSSINCVELHWRSTADFCVVLSRCATEDGRILKCPGDIELALLLSAQLLT